MFVLVLISMATLLIVNQLLWLIWPLRYALRIRSVQPAYAIVGHLPLFWGKSNEQAFEILTKCFAQLDRLGKIWFGPLVMNLVSHPDLLQQILTGTDVLGRPFLYDFLGLKNGILTERDGAKWINSRKALSPTFNTRMLMAYIPIMDSRAKKMAFKLQARANTGEEFDIFQYAGECTLEMVLSTTMGRNANELPGQKEYVQNLDFILRVLGERIMNVNQHIGVFYRMSKMYKKEQAARKIGTAFIDKVIRERRSELEKEKQHPVTDAEYKRKSLNFLDQILTIRRKDGTAFSDQEVASNLNQIMAAGNDTSSLTISFSCLMLAMYPEVQAKVVAEMAEVFYSDEVEITQDSLRQLQYTEQVIKEVLRLFPPVPFAARETSSEIQLDGVQIPKNQIILFSLFNLHRRPDLWGPDPDRFNPDRFLPDAVAARHPYAYLPFIAGLRDCIGARYAMNSIRIVLLRILQRFEIGTSLKMSDFRYKFEITMKLVGPHNVWLKQRNNKAHSVTHYRDG